MSQEKIYTYTIEHKITDIEGTFIATPEEIEELKGVEVEFGEISKHFHPCLEIYPFLKVYEDDPEKVKQVKEVMGTSISGYNPFEHYPFVY